ncbi:Protein-glutamine gamma-glutamyltransferase [Clostridium sp. N3C]|uniref:transglutaminase domain-containing protein n=1 Tax=Clostridium sp. N3C TaxID=1776758 RepID=UPI00092E05FF|nr:transglutaminase domain-containing protein [Clostridium sp. N3C]SCN22594.1 Protein-glutamine gamma-glutamyltransferase [Clostridium sp. N3C]
MEWFKQHIVGIFVHYINILFIFILMTICYRIDDFNYLYITLIYVAVIMLYLFFNGVLNTAFKKFIFLAILFTALVIFAFIFKAFIMDFFYQKIIYNIGIINNKLYDGQVTFFYMYRPIITVALPAILIVLFILYEHRVTNGILLLSLSEMIFFWYLEYKSEVTAMILPFTIIFIGTYMLNNYKKSEVQFQKKGIYSSIDGKKLFINILVFTIVASIISLPLPQEIEGKDNLSILKALDKKQQASNGLVNVESATKGVFSLGQTGYSNTEKKLGGPIQLNKTLAFKVKSDKSYYLKGDVKDEYTGFSWRNTIEDLQAFESNISPEVEKARYSNYTSNLFPSTELKELTIYPANLKTTSFMVPMYTNYINYSKKGIIVAEDRAIFMANDTIKNEYTVQFYDADFTNLKQDYYGLYYFQNENYQKYLQLPEGITERTADLVYNLVKDCNTVSEKVEKIRNYLSENYTYTLNASQLPEGKDFVDYFLFEDPKGYCVHFATALTIMYRIAGIPARFVEGYKMNDATIKNGLYNVTNDTAHAWVEYLVMDDVWAISDCAPTAFEENLRTQEQENQQNEEKPVTDINTQTKKTENITSTINKNNTKDEKNNTITLKIGSRIIYIAITVLVLSLILLRIAFSNSRKRKMLNSESTIPLYSYVLKRLKRYKIKKDPALTDKEFAQRQEKELQEILLPLTEQVYVEFYGGIKNKKFEKSKTYYSFEQYLKKKENNLKYFLKKIF